MDEKTWTEMFDSRCKEEGTSFIEFLLETGIGVNSVNKFGTTMLCCAAECGNLEVVEYLLEKGADSSISNSDGSNALNIAEKNGHNNIVQFFLDKGIFQK